MSYNDVYNLPTIRRKIFISNFNHFKSLEKKQMEEDAKQNRTLNKGKYSFS